MQKQKKEYKGYEVGVDANVWCAEGKKYHDKMRDVIISAIEFPSCPDSFKTSLLSALKDGSDHVLRGARDGIFRFKQFYESGSFNEFGIMNPFFVVHCHLLATNHTK